MTYEDLHQAFLAHRRAHGGAATAAVLAKFGADHLERIPESSWQDLLAALDADGVEHQEFGAPREIDPERIWARFNRRES